MSLTRFWIRHANLGYIGQRCIPLGVSTVPVRSAKLKSSWLSEAHYDDETQTLTVHTAKGTKHEHQVSPEVFAEMCAADSPGQYYNAKLRTR
jgi:hypothetical protein